MEYAAHPNLFRDISFFMTKIAHRLRGDDARRVYGECTEQSYLSWLAGTGAITQEEFDEQKKKILGK